MKLIAIRVELGFYSSEHGMKWNIYGMLRDVLPPVCHWCSL